MIFRFPGEIYRTDDKDEYRNEAGCCRFCGSSLPKPTNISDIYIEDRESMEEEVLCIEGLREWWNIPDSTKTIVVCVSTEPIPDTYKIRRKEEDIISDFTGVRLGVKIGWFIGRSELSSNFALLRSLSERTKCDEFWVWLELT